MTQTVFAAGTASLRSGKSVGEKPTAASGAPDYLGQDCGIEKRELLELAECVLKPGDARLYRRDGSNNLANEWCSLSKAVDSGRPFAGEVADDIFVLDADSAKHNAALDEVARELLDHSIQPVIVCSGGFDEAGNARRHLFAHIPSITLKEWIAQRAHLYAGDKTVAPSRRPIRPPLSPHRSGRFPSLVQPSTIREAIGALTPTISRFEPRISRRMIDLLQHGDIAGQYAKRDHAIQAVINSMVAAKWSKHRIFAAIMNPTKGVGAKWQEIARTDPEDATRRFENSFTAASARVTASPTVSSRVRPMCLIERFVQDLVGHRLHEFKKLSGKIAFAVLCVHIHTAHQLGRFRYSLPERTARKFCRVQKRDTIRQANRWLEERGFIRRVGIKKSGRISQFELLVPSTPRGNLGVSVASGLGSEGTQNGPFCTPFREGGRRTEGATVYPYYDPTLFPLPEAFLSGRAGLGFGPMFAWIVADDLTRSQVAERLGIDPHTAGVHLARLEKVGLARCLNGSWRAIRSKVALDAAARRLGVLGTRKILQGLDEIERSRFRNAGRSPLASETSELKFVETAALKLDEVQPADPK